MNPACRRRAGKSGLKVLWPQMLRLFILGATVITASSLRFRKKLE